MIWHMPHIKGKPLDTPLNRMQSDLLAKATLIWAISGHAYVILAMRSRKLITHPFILRRTGLVAARGASIRFFAVARARVEVDATPVFAKSVAARTQSVVAIRPGTVFASLAGLEGFFKSDSPTERSGWIIIADEGRLPVISAIRIESATNPLCFSIHHLITISAESGSALIGTEVPVVLFFHPIVECLVLITIHRPIII